MKSLVALAVPVLCLAVQAALAMDPGEAGRQAHRELDALMAKQRSETLAATETTADNSVPKPPSKANDRRAIKSIDSRVPSICSGC